MEIIQKISRIFAGIVAGVSLVIVITMAALGLKGAIRPDETPEVFGLVPLIVNTDSMAPAFESGDLIIGVRAEASQVQPGEVISFRDPASPDGSVVTHRVMEILETPDRRRLFRTRGDANNTWDEDPVPGEALQAVWRGFRVKGLGKAIAFLRTGPGLLICFLAPLLLFLVPEAVFDLIERRRKTPAGLAAAGQGTHRQPSV